MAEDTWETTWGDFGDFAKAFAVLAVAYGASKALNGEKKQKAQATDVPFPESEPSAIILVGDNVKVAGKYAFFEAKGTQFLSIQAINDGRVDSISRFWLNDDEVTRDNNGWVVKVNGDDMGGNGRYVRSRVKIDIRLGLPTETAYGEVIHWFPELWDTTCRGDNTASVMMRCDMPEQKYRGGAFPNGRPTLWVLARGVCYDWRKDSSVGGVGSQRRANPATWTWSVNPVVWRVHLDWFRFGKKWDRVMAPVLDKLTAAANYCDEAVPLAAGGSEPRYRLAYKYTADTNPADVRAAVDASMAAFTTYDVQGRLVVKPGGYEAPTYILTDSHITNWKWSLGQPVEDGVDSIIISYIEPKTGYNSSQCDPWIVNENGNRSITLNLEAVYSFSQGRRLAKIKAAELMPEASGTIDTDISGMDGLGECYIGVQNSARAFMSDIVGKVSAAPEFNAMSGKFTYPLALATADPFEWVPANEEGAAPLTITRPTEVILDAPIITSLLSVRDEVAFTREGRRLSIGGLGPDRLDLTWSWRWRVQGTTKWREGVDTDATGGTVSLLTDFVATNTTIEAQISYSTGGGKASPWSDTSTVYTYIGGLDFSKKRNSQYLALLFED